MSRFSTIHEDYLDPDRHLWPDYEEEVVKDERTLAEMATQMADLLAVHANLKKQAAEIWHQVDELRLHVIPVEMENQGIESVRIVGIGRLNIREEASCKTLDKPALFDWLRENGLQDIITEVVNASTLKAFIREQLKEGNPIPNDEIVDFSTYRVASITKG